jgi:hypothetical protein
MVKTIRSRVTTSADVNAVNAVTPGAISEDSYLAKLVRYIPGEIVGAYLALFNAAKAADQLVVLGWIVGILLVLTPLWILSATRDSQKPIPYFQAFAAMFAFLVWLFAIPETPFSTLPGFNPFYGFVALVLSTMLIPIVEKVFVK